MTKQDIAYQVGKSTGLDKEQAMKAVEATIAAIKANVSQGKSIYLRGFGTFTPKQRAAKVARNISKGTQMVIPAHKKPHFKPSKAFTIKAQE